MHSHKKIFQIYYIKVVAQTFLTAYSNTRKNYSTYPLCTYVLVYMKVVKKRQLLHSNILIFLPLGVRQETNKNFYL